MRTENLVVCEVRWPNTGHCHFGSHTVSAEQEILSWAVAYTGKCHAGRGTWKERERENLAWGYGLQGQTA